METTTLDIAGRLYTALASGDLPALADLLHPDVVLHVPGDQPQSGAHRGRDAVLRFVGVANGVEAGTEVLDLMGGGEHAAAYVRVHGERDGAHLDNHTVHLLRIDGGRVVEVWFHNRDQAHVDAFWTAALPPSEGAA